MADSIDNKSVSSWVRQARYRAKKHDIYSDLEVTDVQLIIKEADGKCAYCGQDAVALDCPFPLKDKGPHVPANVVPCCRDCKSVKGSNDIVWLFSQGHIGRNRYLALIEELFKRRGGDQIKEHVRRATGLVDADSEGDQ
jgi:hypothetical protein